MMKTNAGSGVRRFRGSRVLGFRGSRVLVLGSLALSGVVALRGAVPATAPEAAPTFSANVAPIVYANCVVCHRPGQAAPFSLLTYDDVKKRGALIVSVTARHYMPPWHATP